MRIGIDFGTTRTVVALARDGRHPLVAFDAGGEFHEYVPGVAVIANGDLIVGWEAAKALANGEADSAIRSIKRAAAGLPPDDEVPGLPGVTALALVTKFLTEVRDAILYRSNASATKSTLEAMVSVPANA